MKILGPDGHPIDSESIQVKKSPKQLSHEIIKIVVDKLLIGLVLVVAALLASFLLEKFKADETFRSEMNLLRAQKIGETWESIFLAEGVFLETSEQLSTTFMGAKRRFELKQQDLRKRAQLQVEEQDSDPEHEKKLRERLFAIQKEAREAQASMKDIESRFSTQIKNTRELVRRNRLWLGEDQYSVANNFIAIFSSGSVPIPTSDEDTLNSYLNEKEGELNRWRVEYIEIIDSILGKTPH